MVIADNLYDGDLKDQCTGLLFVRPMGGLAPSGHTGIPLLQPPY